jgi:DNA-directed RNA polymerase subunit RPC12/RpoP
MAHTSFNCQNCGGGLTFAPGTTSLECPYCGTLNEIAGGDAPPAEYEELDLSRAEELFSQEKDLQAVQIIKCPACQAEVTLEGTATTGECDYCGTALVATGNASNVMKPQYLLPFKLKKQEAGQKFKQWLKKLWFAPNAVKKYARVTDPMKGFYFPFWTYDAQTRSQYRGERGENYQVQVKSQNSEGETVTRSETKTRWYSASGTVSRFFDDVLIPASQSLPGDLTTKLDQWDLKQMVAYKEDYLSGFKAESYSVNVQEGFSQAKDVMAEVIRRDVRRDIGGDKQRIHSVETHYSGTTFKYIILPVWNLTYKFKQKYFNVLVNGQTGEVEGQRPWSFWKIAFTVLGVIGLGVGGYFLYQYLTGNL